MKRHALLVLALSIFCYSKVLSQYFQPTNFKDGSGLPSSESYKVFQDSRGFVWIATDNGVVKYDGQEFVTYNTTHGLTDNTVFGFHEDQKGRIWFRTYNGALSYYEGDTIKSYKFNTELKAFIKSTILITIHYDSLDELHFSTAYDAFAGKVDSVGNVTLTSSLDWAPPGEGWKFIAYVGDKMAFVSEPPRNIRFMRIDEKIYPIELDDAENQNVWLMPSAYWRGKLYFTMYKNIFSYDGKTVKKVFTASEPFISMFVDKEDRLWVGYYNKGVNIFSDESLNKPDSLANISNLSVSSIFQDYEGGMWISTLDQGVFYFPNLTVQKYDLPNSKRVSAVVFGKNDVFLGNYGGEVFNMNDKGTVRFVSRGKAPISNLFLSDNGKLWITDGTGTHIHEAQDFVAGKRGLSFEVLTQSGDQIVGSNSIGIYKLTANGTSIEKMDRRMRPISMTIANNGLYLGMINGVEKYSVDLKGPPVKINNHRTSALFTIQDRFVVGGTIGHGLFVYDSRKDKISDLPVADVNNVYAIIGDERARRLWIGTEEGLFQLDFSFDTTDLKLVHFSKADGLASSKINYLGRIGNKIWAGSDLGISSVPLEHFGERRFEPRFYINRILFKDRSVTVEEPYVRTEEEDMVVSVRAITFKGHPTFFRYRFRGDQLWNAVSRGNIFLTDLSPGSYFLEIQSSSGDGKWTDGLTLQIDVLARWWQTWPFRISVIVAVFLIGYTAYWLRIKAIQRRQKYLELINSHQLKLIDSEIRTQERERKRIATDLHDGIGASLSSIKIQIADAMSGEGEEISGKGKEISDNLTDVIDDIKRIVYDLHPPGLERYGLQSGLKSLVDRLNKTGNINVIFDYYGKRDIAHPVSITIFRILQELINNTLKHARASEIRIHINEFDDEINIMYEDNGIGMIGSRFNGLGMHSIESRVRSLEGRMSWESNHKGTFYSFDIPF